MFASFSWKWHRRRTKLYLSLTFDGLSNLMHCNTCIDSPYEATLSTTLICWINPVVTSFETSYCQVFTIAYTHPYMDILIVQKNTLVADYLYSLMPHTNGVDYVATPTYVSNDSTFQELWTCQCFVVFCYGLIRPISGPYLLGLLHCTIT